MGALRPLPRSVIDDSLASWDFICKQLRKRILENHFQAWIEPLRVLKFDRKRLLLQTESAFAKSWIQEHYSKVILEVLGEHCALAVDFRLELRSSLLRIS
jgi:chromosomal replication initiator protein